MFNGLIKCDNQAVVSVLTTGKTRNRVMAKYARNVFLWLSAFNIDIQVVVLLITVILLYISRGGFAVQMA